MTTEQNIFYPLRCISILLVWVFFVSCTSKDNLAGVYKTEEKNLPKQVETLLELKPNGNGAWKVGEEEVPFSWYTTGDELRINTKGGGVIVGYIENNTIRMTIPGTPEMSFKKIQ